MTSDRKDYFKIFYAIGNALYGRARSRAGHFRHSSVSLPTIVVRDLAGRTGDFSGHDFVIDIFIVLYRGTFGFNPI